MTNRARHSYLTALILFAVLQLSSCALTPDSFHSVEIVPKGTVVIGQSGIVSITANVLNDTVNNGGVLFTAAPLGTGTLTQTTTTSATYVAPAVVTTETIVLITATSVDFTKQSATLTVKIEPPPVITTTSLPSAPLNQAYSQPVMATGGVPPLTWAIASGSLPAGLSLAPSTTDTVNITGKATSAGNSTFTIMVTDATGASSTSGPLNIVVSTLAFTTTSPLPAGTINMVYSNVQFAATGGTSPYTFALASGSTLPPGLNFTGGLLSGTPTTAGNFSFGVTLSDSEPTPAVITQTFTLAVSGAQNPTLLSGAYAFTFSGNNAGGFIAAAGTFTANGAGLITGGEATYNSLAGPPVTYTGIMGTYTAGTDGRGTITFTTSTPAFPLAPTYAFAIDPGGSGHGRLIEFDSTGARGSGRLEFQTVSTCVVSNTITNTYSGNFAFAGTGFTTSIATGAGPIALVGEFTAAPPTVAGLAGSIGPGEMDANLFGTVSQNQTLSGTFASGADTTQCTFTFTPQFTAGSITYSAYPVSGAEAFLVESDQVNSNGFTPFLSVIDMLQQFGQPFLTQNAITGPMAGGLSGNSLVNGQLVQESAILQISVANSGAGNFDLLLTDNTAGTITSNMAPKGGASNPLAVSYSSDQFGRVTTANSLTSPSYFQPVLYLVSPTEAFFLTSTAQQGQPPLLGHLSPQSAGPFSAASLSGNYAEGSTAPPSAASRNLSGALKLDGVSAITGTQDESTTAANTPGEAVLGTYSLFDTANGTGSLTLTSPAAFSGAYVIVSPTKFVFLTTTAGDTNPIVIVAGH
jgi:putative Ig domain-containing protein